MSRKVFENSVMPLSDEPGLAPMGMMVNARLPENSKQKMTLLFSLAPPDNAMTDLEAKVARGEVVPPEELQKSYGSKPADVKKLKAWLKSNGYKIVQASSDNTSIYAENSVSKIEKTLGVNMVRVTRDGVTYNAAQDAPSLPADVGEGVHAIIGLQPFRKAHKHFRSFIRPVATACRKALGRPAQPRTSRMRHPTSSPKYSRPTMPMD